MRGGEYLTEDDLGVYEDKDDQLANYGAEDTNGQCSTAVMT